MSMGIVAFQERSIVCISKFTCPYNLVWPSILGTRDLQGSHLGIAGEGGGVQRNRKKPALGNANEAVL